jgi:uncharacterized protein
MEYSMTKDFNPVLYAVIGIPLATVLAGFATLYLAFTSNGHELPAEYASEGSALAADLERAQAARDQYIHVRLDFTSGGQIEAVVSGLDPAAAPPSLRLAMTHATLPQLDQSRVLRLLDPATGRYGAEGAPLPEGAWWLEVAHDPEWRLRGKAAALHTSVDLGTRP